MTPIYATADGAEALCLYTAGIPLHPDKVAENIYETEWLDAHGFASVKDAVKARRHGLRAWFFIPSPAQQKLSNAFQSQKRELQSAGADKPTVDLPELGPETLAKMCAFLHANRQFLENLWKQVPPQKSSPDGRGGRNIIGENASEENRRRLGV